MKRVLNTSTRSCILCHCRISEQFCQILVYNFRYLIRVRVHAFISKQFCQILVYNFHYLIRVRVHAFCVTAEFLSNFAKYWCISFAENSTLKQNIRQIPKSALVRPSFDKNAGCKHIQSKIKAN